MQINSKIHFIGISGIGMSGIAELMLDKGYSIQGSDISVNDNTKRLKKKGIKFFLGHNKKNIKNAHAIVYSSAIKKNNPEIREAYIKKIPVLSRADMLSELMKNKKSIAIAGSHGKTTTTSLVGNIFNEAGLDPTIVNGGIINSFSNNNRYGKGEWMIVEADESDGTCYDDKNLKLLINKIKTRNILTYSIKNKKADVLIFDIIQNKLKTSFKLKINNKIIHSSNYKFTINAIGNHNILNATASIIAAKLNGIKNKDINNALINYVGVKRRFSFIGKKNKSFVYDDYAHHPTEIAATLSAAKSLKNKVIVVFQPHRYTRTKILIREFIKVLSKVDYLFLLETYSAGEKIIKGATSKDIYSKILKKNKNTIYLKNIGDLNKLMKPYTLHQNTIVFMGAGSISSIAKKYLNN